MTNSRPSTFTADNESASTRPRRRRRAVRDDLLDFYAGPPAADNSAGTPTDGSDQRPIITQAMLHRYHELQQLNRERRQLRLLILQMHEEGLEVERGDYAPRIREYESRQLSATNLLPIIGNQQVTWLKESVVPQRHRSLHVYLHASEARPHDDSTIPSGW